MILGNLTLTNFSAYGGSQSIDLAPQGVATPIVLVGGLNGAGKTSLLTGIRLALFGKRVMQFSTDSASYTGLLRGLVHDRTHPVTSVDLTFHTYSLGERETYRVLRGWSVADNGKVSESLQVWKNDSPDDVLVSTWDDFIDTILPASIAHLFFFDGEKVAEMANAEGARALLQTGVQSLLGIDLLARLRDDLADLVSRKTRERDDSGLGERLSVLEADLAELARQGGELAAQVATGEAAVAVCRQQVEEVEQRFRDAGAHLFLERKAIEAELEAAQDALAEVNDALVELASGSLPLALVTPLLDGIRKQDLREHEAQKALAVLDVLEVRDRATLAMLDNAPPDLRRRLESFLADDRNERGAATRTAPYLNLPQSARNQLAELPGLLATEKARGAALLEQQAAAEARLLDARRRMAMVPPEEVVAAVLQERKQVLAALQTAEDELAALSRKVQQVEQVRAFRMVERDRAVRHIGMQQGRNTQDDRVVLYAQRARERVQAFAASMLRHSIESLEGLILESIRQLFRKVDFVCGVGIDPDTYSLELRDGRGSALPLDQLSAGERQLVIIAILWGLGRASGRPLPMIIDTPLGRLDSRHRDNLLENYFPTASHQLILLATDTEVTEADAALLEPYLGGRFRLLHDDRMRRTRIEPGYFWSMA
ncbi:MAG TPA: DNA sulfur modification protein DndD [Nitratidesulfovibrio sp.]|nr:DNA sulfur modification protein DndD [Nitratidesulfovibrio sp.]